MEVSIFSNYFINTQVWVSSAKNYYSNEMLIILLVYNTFSSAHVPTAYSLNLVNCYKYWNWITEEEITTGYFGWKMSKFFWTNGLLATRTWIEKSFDSWYNGSFSAWLSSGNCNGYSLIPLTSVVSIKNCYT